MRTGKAPKYRRHRTIRKPPAVWARKPDEVCPVCGMVVAEHTKWTLFSHGAVVDEQMRLAVRLPSKWARYGG